MKANILRVKKYNTNFHKIKCIAVYWRNFDTPRPRFVYIPPRNCSTFYLLEFLLYSLLQGYNARKVISDVYSSFVLQCTVYGRGNVNTRWMLQSDMGSIFSHKKSMKYSGHRKLLYEYQNCQYQCFYLPRILE